MNSNMISNSTSTSNDDQMLIVNTEPVQWQHIEHMSTRQIVVLRLAAFMKQRNYAFFGKSGNGADRLPDIARRLELILYSRAASFNEYKNFLTLKRRLRHIISTLFRHAEHEAPGVLGKRKSKRLCQKKEKVIFRKRTRTYHDNGLSATFLVNGDMNLNEHIFSFLTGTETMKFFTINKCAAAILPRAVHVLEINISTLGKLISGDKNGDFLSAFPNLESLCIKGNDRTVVPRDPVIPKSLCAPLQITSSNDGERIANQLGIILQNGKCSKLKKLSMISTFAHTPHENAVNSLGNAIANGSLPLLQELSLGGNSLGDDGVINLIQCLRKSSCIMKYLDLRSNFIGERGCTELVKYIQEHDKCQLHSLRLSFNIVTDHCAELFLNMMENFHVTQLKHLDLGYNFMTSNICNALLEYRESNYCKKLTCISIIGNDETLKD